LGCSTAQTDTGLQLGLWGLLAQTQHLPSGLLKSRWSCYGRDIRKPSLPYFRSKDRLPDPGFDFWTWLILVFKGQPEIGAKPGGLALFNFHIQLLDLCDSQIAQGTGRFCNGLGGCIFPGCGAGPNKIDNFVDTFAHDTLLEKELKKKQAVGARDE
jgi:hypothetical protein